MKTEEQVRRAYDLLNAQHQKLKAELFSISTPDDSRIPRIKAEMQQIEMRGNMLGWVLGWDNTEAYELKKMGYRDVIPRLGAKP